MPQKKSLSSAPRTMWPKVCWPMHGHTQTPTNGIPLELFYFHSPRQPFIRWNTLKGNLSSDEKNTTPKAIWLQGKAFLKRKKERKFMLSDSARKKAWESLTRQYKKIRAVAGGLVPTPAQHCAHRCAGEKSFPCWLTAPSSGVVCVHCWAEFALQIYLCVFRLALFAEDFGGNAGEYSCFC